uniref:DUF632 domain-containing protein n=1 Tax=Ananas comosus var. bracteatus TaxID=296719 RepID=A0A6V7PND7_ANACO|nr:unnamed protein product [Ananas comosus var. bracteatus]
MGCSSSKVNDNDDDDAIRICRDRRNFIKQAIEQRNRFASSHVAYIHSLLRVSFALCYFFEGISLTVNCLRSVGNPLIPMEQRWPQSPETIRLESYYPIDLREPDTRTNPPFFSSPYIAQNYLQEPPQWDFWNPFPSMDGYENTFQSTPDCLITDEGLRQAREDEGVPDLEEDNKKIESSPVYSRSNSKAIDNGEPSEAENKTEDANEGQEMNTHPINRSNASEERRTVEVNNERRRIVGSAQVGEEETRGFVVYVNSRPTSMAEVMKDLESQFAKICDSSSEVSVLLETTRTTERYPNLPRASTYPNNDGNESGGDNTEESLEIFKSHKSTLDRLYMWEKKLYEEVKLEEQIRYAYEKKCMQLKKQDENGAEPSAVNKTRAAIRDLQTKLRVSISAIEYISERIEVLRDEELHPQLVELIKGLARMWRAMAESHRIQRRTLDEAKLLLLSSFAAAREAAPPPPPRRTHRAAAVLAAELRVLRASLASWVGAQRAYAAALAGWISRCAPPPLPGAAPPPLPPPPVYGWAEAAEGEETEVAEGEGERAVAAGAAEAVGAAAELAGAAAEGFEDLVRALQQEEEEEENERAEEERTPVM